MRLKLLIAVVGLVVVLPLLALAIPGVRVSVVEHRDRAFVYAAGRGDVRGMRVWRIMGADVRKPVPGTPPAIVAAGWSGKTEAIQYLLDNGADVNQRDKYGWTALIAAANEGHLEAVRYLITRTADVNATGEDGSALRLAREDGHSEVASFLEAHGARDRHGYQADR